MVKYFECPECQKVSTMINEDEKKCPLCGSTSGYFISHDHMREGLDAGVYFNIDHRTGKRSKKKK